MRWPNGIAAVSGLRDVFDSWLIAIADVAVAAAAVVGYEHCEPSRRGPHKNVLIAPDLVRSPSAQCRGRTILGEYIHVMLLKSLNPCGDQKRRMSLGTGLFLVVRLSPTAQFRRFPFLFCRAGTILSHLLGTSMDSPLYIFTDSRLHLRVSLWGRFVILGFPVSFQSNRLSG